MNRSDRCPCGCVKAEDVVSLHDDRKWDEEHRGRKMSDHCPVDTGNSKE